LVNRKRDLVVEGQPLVLGFVAVGDALICTNPLYGRGCSLGAVLSRALAAAIRDHGDDLPSLALSMHASAQEEIVPWYEASVAQDEMSRQARAGDGTADLAMSLITEGLLPLTRIDAKVSRAFFRTLNLLTSPNEVMSDPDLAARVFTYWQARASRPPAPPLGPTRAEMVASLRGD
jgi:flavin-dependent dehydrogenase